MNKLKEAEIKALKKEFREHLSHIEIIDSTQDCTKAIPMTSSLCVAQIFGKRHNNVMRKIRNIMAKNSEEFNNLNFKQSSYNAQELANGVIKEQPCYLMTKEAVFQITRNWEAKKEIAEFCGNIIVEKGNRFEESFFEKLKNFLKPLSIDVVYQKIINEYRLDFYLPQYNLVIEYDEEHHKYTLEKDKKRMDEITRALNCDWLRLDYKNTDEFNLGLIAQKILKY